MNLRKLALTASLGAVIAVVAGDRAGDWQQSGQGTVLSGPGVHVPAPIAPNGAPWANGYVDYLKLVNARGRYQRRQAHFRGV
jgi:branched-chain amino acid transport system substrate-binding protein